ncbi:MAG: type II secretion system F family protein [Opitutales bacterium]|nr:type II secretion system F family protein [Opitutales bacterium]
MKGTATSGFMANGASDAVTGKGGSGRPAVRRIGNRAEKVTLFTRQLSTLLRAGVPLTRALETLRKQERQKAFRQVIDDLVDQVRGGNKLSDGLARYPLIFDGLYVNMVRAGESGSILEDVLLRVATFLEKARALKRKVRAALVYPAVVIVVASVIVGFLVSYVIPQFETIFTSMLRGQRLPALTEGVLALSDFVRDRWWVLGGGLVVIALGWNFARRTEAGGRLIDRVSLSLPIVGDLVRKISIARFARTFGTLIASGVPILEALRIARDVSGNRVVENALTRVHDRVRDGDPVARPLEQTNVFPVMVSSMIEVGEETGQLPAMLDRIADDYEEDVDTAVAGLTSALEPVLIVLLAVVVGTIVIALFLPIIAIIQNLQ